MVARRHRGSSRDAAIIVCGGTRRRARRIALAHENPGRASPACCSRVAPVVPGHAADPPAARRAATRPRRSSRSCASRAPRTPSRPRWPSAAASRASCTTCSRTRCRALALQLEGARLLARDRGADPEVVDGARARAPPRGERADRGARRRSPRCAATSCPRRRTSPLASVRRRATLTVTGEPREPSSEARLALYRTAQEALTNVRRHSAAERVELRLDYARRRHALAVAGPRRRRAPATAGRRRLRADRHARARRAARRAPAAPGRPTTASASSCGCRRDPRPARRRPARRPRGPRHAARAARRDRARRHRRRRRGGARARRRARPRRRADGPADAALRRHRGDPAARRARRAAARDRADHLRRRRVRARRAARRRARLPDQGRGRRGDPRRGRGRRPRRGGAGPGVQHHVVAALSARAAAAAPELPDELTPREAEVLGADRRGPHQRGDRGAPGGERRDGQERTSTTSSPRPAPATARRPSSTPTRTAWRGPRRWPEPPRPWRRG